MPQKTTKSDSNFFRLLFARKPLTTALDRFVSTVQDACLKVFAKKLNRNLFDGGFYGCQLLQHF